MDLHALPPGCPGGELPGRVDGAHRHGLQHRGRAGGPHPRYGPPSRGDPRFHRADTTALSDPASHPGSGCARVGRNDRGERNHAVPPVGPASQRVLRRSQGEPVGASARRLRRLDHRAAPRADPDTRGNAGRRRRPRPRRHHQGCAAGCLVTRPGVGLPRGPGHRPSPALRQGLHVDRMRSVHACHRRRRERAGRPLVVGGRFRQGVPAPSPLETGGQADLRGSPVSVPLGEARSTSRP